MPYAVVARTFGTDQIFLDDETLHAGQWRVQIEAALKSRKITLVVISTC